MAAGAVLALWGGALVYFVAPPDAFRPARVGKPTAPRSMVGAVRSAIAPRSVWLADTGPVVRQRVPFHGTPSAGPVQELLVYTGEISLTWDLADRIDGTVLVRGAADFSQVTIRGMSTGARFHAEEVWMGPTVLRAGSQTPSPLEARIVLTAVNGVAAGLLVWNLELTVARADGGDADGRVTMRSYARPE